MKKTVIALTLLAFAAFSSAENDGPSIMNGIYGTRSRSVQTERPRSTHHVTTDALRRFVEMQNPDGSWGADGTQQISTAFCLISFLRHGETHHSEKFGQPIANAHAWLMTSQPKSDPERVATAIALSDYITVHFSWHAPDAIAAVPAAQIQKIRDCINAISPQCSEMWRDLLALSSLPKEVGRHLDGDTIRIILDKYLDRRPDGPPSTLDDYVRLYLTFSGLFCHGGKPWSEFNQQFSPMMIRILEADGLVPCQPPEDRIAATGLSVMSMTVYYKFAPNFWSVTGNDEGDEIMTAIK